MDKLKIVTACGNGMGTSMLMKFKLEAIIKKLSIDGSVNAFSIGESQLMVDSVDLIFCSVHLEDNFNKNGKAKIIGIKNLLDEQEIETKLKIALSI